MSAGFIITVFTGEEYKMKVDFPERVETVPLLVNYLETGYSKRHPPSTTRKINSIYNVYRIRMVTLKEALYKILIPNEVIMNFTTTEN